ncbi:UNVERIFIED_CONTAM: hypothetical protein GTU68_049233 [Idotea baltica]|nr:hypothetical protein [Idotea baltica]MCL4136323.1 hypothetical protein [Idotea baltica]
MCNYCKTGKYNLCPDMIFCATPPVHGNLSRYYKHAADFCFKLPDHVSLEEGALLEPLSVAVHACRRANVVLGSRVLICGSGPIGLVSLLAAKAMGATTVCVTDIVDEKLQIAKDLGADFTINVRSGNAEEIAQRVTDLMGGNMADISIECSGAESSIRLGIFADEPGGMMVLVGLGPPRNQIPIVNAAVREVDIEEASSDTPTVYPLGLEMIARCGTGEREGPADPDRYKNRGDSEGLEEQDGKGQRDQGHDFVLSKL